MAYKSIALFTATIFISLSMITYSPAMADEEKEEHKSAGTLFFEAFQEQDEKAMKELIKTRANDFPPEVIEMVRYAMNPDVAPEEAKYIFSVAGLIAKMFGDETGDQRLLQAVSVNYGNFLKSRDTSILQPEVVDKTKKEITDLGTGNWRVNVFKMGPDGGLIVEIDVRESSGASSFETPKINLKESRKVVQIVKANLPKVKKGKITWSSMGVGLKTVFIE
ncbi:hypothetical protein MNBD_NITROSPINAE02-1175 [hydrothermal vent metagenome]|uniref:Uncharacterized protein n=1 Tax=hydrothermal vent metagenome TaxID=652676 RepID=A0A3B1C5Q7_9ZZZZ